MKKLILLPNVLHEESTWTYEPPCIDALIAESSKGGYRFLKRFHLPPCPIYLLNEHTKTLDDLLKIGEERVGLISDAGLPCLADPGAPLVAAAREMGVEVEVVPGPSSLLMALQLSGFSGQAFTFHGYFPREEKKQQLVLQRLDRFYTHLFIEAPYKTEKTFHVLLKQLPHKAKLCVALELTGPHSYVKTKTIHRWHGQTLPISKARAVFLISFSPL